MFAYYQINIWLIVYAPEEFSKTAKKNFKNYLESIKNRIMSII